MPDTFTVATHNFAPGAFGDTLTTAELDGLNIPALVEGGHLVPTASKPPTKPPTATPASPATETKE